MSQRIPDRVDPWRLAEQGETLSGSLPLASMPRLAALLQDTDHDVAFTLRFGRDRDRRSTVKLDVQASLVLECQRCLDSMTLEVDAETPMALVNGPVEAEQLPGELDPLMLAPEAYLDIAELIEDELLLAIPASPRHAHDDCIHPREQGAAEPAGNEQENPFAILAQLKEGGNHN
ncbi:YceD family protein [Thiolapillus sp.]